jgi:hypothetical protein
MVQGQLRQLIISLAWRRLWILAVAALSASATPKRGKGQVIGYTADPTDRLTVAITRLGGLRFLFSASGQPPSPK